MSGRVALLCIALVAASPIASAQDSLTAARELYVSADYENALAMLGRQPELDTLRQALARASRIHRSGCKKTPYLPLAHLPRTTTNGHCRSTILPGQCFSAQSNSLRRNRRITG